MTTSSVPLDYSLTSNDTITFDTSNIGNITVSGSGTSYYYTGGSMGTVTVGSGVGLSPGSISTISISDLSSFQINIPEEWANTFPDWDKVKKMCEEYPGLKIAFEKFKTTYKLVVDHYDTPEDKRPRP